jgi:hypothetical protein
MQTMSKENSMACIDRPTEALTRNNACVVLIDVVDDRSVSSSTFERYKLRKKSEVLVEIAETFALPTVFIGQHRCSNGEFFLQLSADWACAACASQPTSSVCDEPELRKALARFRRKKVLVGGASLDSCAARLTTDLLANGYEPYVVFDTCHSHRSRAASMAITTMTQAGAMIVSSAVVASALTVGRDASKAQEASALYQSGIA